MSQAKPLIYLSIQGPEDPGLKEPVYPGLVYVATALAGAGYRVKTFTLNGPNDMRLLDAVKAERPLFVGFSNYISPRLHLDVALSRKLRRMGVTVVWGGIFSTSLPEIALGSDCVDYIVTGEAEKTAPLLAEAIENNEVPKGIPGVGYRNGGELVIQDPPEPEEDLDRFGYDVDLIDYGKHVITNYKAGMTQAQIPFSRGCPYSCSFCYNSMSAERTRWRVHSAEYLKEVIGRLEKKFGINAVGLVCDNPFGRVGKAKSVIEKLGIKWGSGAHVNVVDEEFVKWARESGCWRLSFGIESGSDRMLERMNKRFTTDRVRQAVTLLKDSGILLSSTWIAMLPKETKDDLIATLKFVDELYQINPHMVRFHSYRAYPRTQFFEEAVAEGYVPPRDIDEWARYDLNIHGSQGFEETWVKRMITLTNILYNMNSGIAPLKYEGFREFLKRRLFSLEFSGPLEESLIYYLRARTGLSRALYPVTSRIRKKG